MLRESCHFLGICGVKAKHIGTNTELKAAAWLLEQGYEVFRNVSSHGEIDLVAIKDGIVRKIDVKTCYRGFSRTAGIEYLSPMADGSWRFMEESKRPMKKKRSREETPREKILRKLTDMHIRIE